MFQHQGIWLPDGEKHFPDWMTKNGELVDGRGTYQIRKFRAAMEFVKGFRVAIDVGAHVGLWTMQLMKNFQRVHAFEPVAVFRECLEKNIKGEERVNIFPVALGNSRGLVKMAYDPADSGGTHVAADTKDADVPVFQLDSYGFKTLDFLKIDCEGYEHHVIAGAADTIMRCWPTVIVEQKPHKLGPNFGIKGIPAVDLLLAMGYVLKREISGDYIMVHR